MEYDFIIDTKNDKRYRYVAESLRELGYDVFEYGTFKGAGGGAVYVLPPSVGLSPDAAAELADGAKLFAFGQSAETEAVLQRKGIELINVFAEEKFACKNAMITAEGALMLVAENTERAFFDMRVLIIGFGRVGKALAKLFKAAACQTDVLTFDRKECAAAALLSDRQYGSFEGVEFGGYAAVINTVPARLVNRHVVAGFRGDAFLLELASEPGGFDRDAVKARSMSFLRAPGLPAKVAPVTAAKILAEEITARLGISY
ncbi:MAG: hypothetical protein LBQ40_07025 [Clostridiales bacterium]|jgi:dipicolinate synthase subunit A|nr:hypothetical protein [Clostridiales bacterium]